MQRCKAMATDVTMTERAARRIGEILKAEPSGAMLRLSVLGGGCSGFQYKFDVERDKAEDDVTIDRDGVTVLVDPVSLRVPGRLRDRLRRRPDRRLVQGQQPEGQGLLRLRDELLALVRLPIPTCERQHQIRSAQSPASAHDLRPLLDVGGDARAEAVGRRRPRLRRRSSSSARWFPARSGSRPPRR